YHRGRYLALPEAGQAGALLVHFRRALLGRLHVVGRNGYLERRFARFNSGFLDENVRHVARNLTGMGMDGAGSMEQTAPCSVLRAVMRPEGLEPPRVAPPAPKAGASANSATVAKPRRNLYFLGFNGVSQRLGSVSCSTARSGRPFSGLHSWPPAQ